MEYFVHFFMFPISLCIHPLLTFPSRLPFSSRLFLPLLLSQSMDGSSRSLSPSRSTHVAADTSRRPLGSFRKLGSVSQRLHRRRHIHSHDGSWRHSSRRRYSILITPISASSSSSLCISNYNNNNNDDDDSRARKQQSYRRTRPFARPIPPPIGHDHALGVQWEVEEEPVSRWRWRRKRRRGRIERTASDD